MSYGTILAQGRFTSDGTAKVLTIPSDADWMKVINYTIADADQTNAVGVEYYWQKGMDDGTGIEYKKSNAANAANLTDALASGGFTVLDANASYGPAITGTTITKADPPVCSALSHGYSDGDLVFFTNLTEMPQLARIAWTVGSVTTDTFELTYMDTNTANFTQESAFTVRSIPESFFTWSDTTSSITAITLGSTTDVQTSNDNSDFTYAVGQVVRFYIPPEFGTVELDGVQGEITAYNSTTNTYTIAVDSSSYTSFAWPTASSVPFSLARLVEVGDASSSPVNPVTNTAALQIKLAAGADSPAGSTSDVIYWYAGKSISVTNE